MKNLNCEVDKTMLDEEKEAIEELKNKKADYFMISNLTGKILLKVIEKQSKEIEHQKEKRENQKQELAILNAKQIEFNKLVNTVNSYKGQFKRQQKEIELLKEENEKYKNPPFFDEDKYTENDKIKAKIEEYDNKGMTINLANRSAGKTFQQAVHYEVKKVLQSLLEKE